MARKKRIGREKFLSHSFVPDEKYNYSIDKHSTDFFLSLSYFPFPFESNKSWIEAWIPPFGVDEAEEGEKGAESIRWKIYVRYLQKQICFNSF